MRHGHAQPCSTHTTTRCNPCRTAKVSLVAASVASAGQPARQSTRHTQVRQFQRLGRLCAVVIVVVRRLEPEGQARHTRHRPAVHESRVQVALIRGDRAVVASSRKSPRDVRRRTGRAHIPHSQRIYSGKTLAFCSNGSGSSRLPSAVALRAAPIRPALARVRARGDRQSSGPALDPLQHARLARLLVHVEVDAR